MNTIPAALAADLRDLFLSDIPDDTGLTSANVRLQPSTDDIPAPRLVILTADPRRARGMDGTAMIPVSIQFISSMDRTTPDAHQVIAGKIDAWWRSIRPAKRRAAISTRIYLHDLLSTQPTTAINAEAREQITTIRGDIMGTLIVPA